MLACYWKLRLWNLFFSAEISDFWLKWNTRMFSWTLIMAQHLVGSGGWVPWLALWWLVLLGRDALWASFQDVTIHPKTFDLWMFVLFLCFLRCGYIPWFYDSMIWQFIASKARDYFQNRTKPYFLQVSKGLGGFFWQCLCPVLDMNTVPQRNYKGNFKHSRGDWEMVAVSRHMEEFRILKWESCPKGRQFSERQQFRWENLSYPQLCQSPELVSVQVWRNTYSPLCSRERS